MLIWMARQHFGNYDDNDKCDLMGISVFFKLIFTFGIPLQKSQDVIVLAQQKTCQLYAVIQWQIFIIIYKAICQLSGELLFLFVNNNSCLSLLWKSRRLLQFSAIISSFNYFILNNYQLLKIKNFTITFSKNSCLHNFAKSSWVGARTQRRRQIISQRRSFRTSAGHLVMLTPIKNIIKYLNKMLLTMLTIWKKNLYILHWGGCVVLLCFL